MPGTRPLSQTSATAVNGAYTPSVPEPTLTRVIALVAVCLLTRRVSPGKILTPILGRLLLLA